MVRTALLACVLLVLGMAAMPAPASADELKGYVPYDGWVRGTPAYHGFAWRDPEVAGTDARRPDFTRASAFDRYELRLKYPLYRDPVHPVHRVATPAGTRYVWPVRTDIQLSAAGVPEISERCPHRRGWRKRCKRDRCARRAACAMVVCCGPQLSPPAALRPEVAAEAAASPRAVEGD